MLTVNTENIFVDEIKKIFIEKVTKHSSVSLLRLVTFSMNKSLDGQL